MSIHPGGHVEIERLLEAVVPVERLELPTL